MDYHTLLSHYIKNSGLSLGKIAKQMEDNGTKIDRSYLSMLQNGRTKTPASEEVNRAIAQVTGGNKDQLVIAAFIEKHPSLKEYLNNSGVAQVKPEPFTFTIRDLLTTDELLLTHAAIQRYISDMVRQGRDRMDIKRVDLAKSALEKLVWGIPRKE